MNKMQQEVVDNLLILYRQDSIPLIFHNDERHKQFQWMLMHYKTEYLWTPKDGLARKAYVYSFNEWVKWQRN